MIDQNSGMLLKLQQSVCAKHGAKFVGVHKHSMVRLALGSLGQQPFQGLRSAPDGESSGWFLWAGQYSTADDFFQLVSYSALFEKCPQVIKYLGLPPGYRFVVDCEGYGEVWLDRPAETELDGPAR